MKKLILVVLMVVLVATPCFAQEVEPESIFSIEGTVWKVTEIGTPGSGYFTREYYLGFSGGNVNITQDITGSWNEVPGNYSYVNLIAASIYINYNSTISRFSRKLLTTAIMQPVGIGIITTTGLGEVCINKGCLRTRPVIILSVGLMHKRDDQWSPDELQ